MQVEGAQGADVAGAKARAKHAVIQRLARVVVLVVVVVVMARVTASTRVLNDQAMCVMPRLARVYALLVQQDEHQLQSPS